MRDTLIMGAVVGLFAFAGNVAGAAIISHTLTRHPHGLARIIHLGFADAVPPRRVHAGWL
jgi:hypothetical protein